MIRRCPNGETPLSAMVGIHEFIRGGERAELKYLSKRSPNRTFVRGCRAFDIGFLRLVEQRGIVGQRT